MQGHVDGVGTVNGSRGRFARIITIAAEPSLIRRRKGSIAIDGIS